MYFFFIRPRRFGKSITLSMLENYYDINKKANLKIFSVEQGHDGFLHRRTKVLQVEHNRRAGEETLQGSLCPDLPICRERHRTRIGQDHTPPQTRCDISRNRDGGMQGGRRTWT